ncbi:MAG: hypothetical protein ACXV3V_09335 [Actinomycetes bacterium]
MRRHETDYVSLVAGVLFLLVAGVHVATGGADNVTLRWTVPALLVLLGLLGLTGALRGSRERREAPDEEPPPPASVLPDASRSADEDATADPASPGDTGDTADTAVLSTKDEGRRPRP